MAFRERGYIRRLFDSHVDRPRTTSNVSHETGGGFDHARRAHGDEILTFVQRTEDAIQFERNLAKPADVRANPTATLAPGKLRWRIVGGRVVKWRSVASIAAAFEQFAVHVDDAHRPCLLVQVVYVLGAEEQAIL